MKTAAVRYSILSVLAFFAICVYNTWSPGIAFMGETADDEFEVKLLVTWVFLGLGGSVFMWGLIDIINWLKKQDD